MPLRPVIHRKVLSGRWPGAPQRRREPLTVNTISLPLGDFRHLSHVSSRSHRDSFGDLAFLKRGHNLLLHSSQSEQNLILACAPPPKPPRLNVAEEDAGGSPDWTVKDHSTVRRKKCNSLPLLDSEEGEELHSEEAVAEISMRQDSLSSIEDTDSTRPDLVEVTQNQDDSTFSLDLDLGPSILDDVLQVMERLHH
ncbi:cdc42 effector protein 2 [Scleropages formosus]|nr:cdc42 effector protein 2-like [Scleropages formosus]